MRACLLRSWTFSERRICCPQPDSALALAGFAGYNPQNPANPGDHDPHAPRAALSTAPRQTPMMEQYFKVKAQHPDALIFYRMGEFYEMFGQDAVTGAKLLDIALTSRDRNKENAVPMCGVPFH